MAILKKLYADVTAQNFIDFALFPQIDETVYYPGILFFPPTNGTYGVFVSEKFGGQTIVPDLGGIVFRDTFSGTPSSPLSLSPNAATDRNIGIYKYPPSGNDPTIFGLGPSSGKSSRIGEGTFAILFESPVSEVGVSLAGIDSDSFDDEYLIFTIFAYAQDGTMLGSQEWLSGEVNISPEYSDPTFNFGIVTDDNQKTIYGIGIEPGWGEIQGFGVFDIKYDGGSICNPNNTSSCPNNEEQYIVSSTGFPIIEDVQVSCSIGFNNQVLKNNNLSEQRIIEHEYPIRNYSISKSIIKSSELTALRNFFHNIKGALGEFLYNDRSDNTATRDDLILLDGAKSWGELVNKAGTDQYQLCKCYQVGSSIHRRPITNPSSVVIYDDLTVVAATLVGGFVEGLPAPSSGSYRASFSFTVPVRLENDILEDKILTKTIDGTKVYSLDELRFVEIKKNLKFYPPSTVADDISHEVAFDLRWGQVSETKYTTEIFTKGSGQESRKQRQRLPEYFVNLQPRGIVLPKQMSYLIALWLCCKGEGYYFDFPDAVSENIYTARFSSPSLQYRNQSTQLIYEFSGIQLKLFKDGIITDNGAYYVKSGNDWVKTASMTDSDVIHFANCLKITTGGGCIYAFTSHDKDIVIGTGEDAITFKASTAISPSAYSSNPALSVNSEEFKTVFLQFDEDKLYSGFFKNAIVETAVIDWQDIPATLEEGIDYQKGVVGKITSNGHYYSFEFLSLGASKLNQTYNPKTTSICRHVFGDGLCQYEKLTLCSFLSMTRTPTPTAIPIEIITDARFEIDHYRYGYVTLPDGTRHTINFLAIFEDNLWINLFNPILQWPEPGDCICISEGCLRTQAACEAYNNIDNFGAIPTTGNWVPGSYEYLSPSINR